MAGRLTAPSGSPLSYRSAPNARERGDDGQTPPPPPLPDELRRLLMLSEEAADRDQAAISMRRRPCGLPAGKTFDALGPDRSAIPPKSQCALRTLEWIDRAEVLSVCGPNEHLSRCPPRCRHW